MYEVRAPLPIILFELDKFELEQTIYIEKKNLNNIVYLILNKIEK